MYNSIYSQIGQYWGEQPGTSGPVYVGAFVMFLFVLGLFIVKGPMKWALLSATVLSVLLSWGKNFMGFTDFFLDYIPMYDKFRAVSSILVIAEFTIPLLAVLALKEVMARPQLVKEQVRSFYISLGLTGGIALLFALAPGFFSRRMFQVWKCRHCRVFRQISWLRYLLIWKKSVRVSLLRMHGAVSLLL